MNKSTIKRVLSILLGIYMVLSPVSGYVSLGLISSETQTAYADSSSISTDFYDNITLNYTIPTVYFKNEIYIVKGKVAQNIDGFSTIILESSDKKTKKYFTGKLSGTSFEIPMYFDTVGTFNIGIIAGESGKSRATKVSVQATPPSKTTKSVSPQRPKNLDIEFVGGKTMVKLPAMTTYVKEIAFVQGQKTVTYFSRQNEKYIPVNYKDFQGFSKKQTTVSVKTAEISRENPLLISSEFSSQVYKKFMPTDHQFSKIEVKDIYVSMPEKLSSVKKISISGRTINEVEKTAYVIKPDGSVEKVELTSPKIITVSDTELVDKNSTFNYSYSPAKKGTYIIEINDKNSIPVVNSPIYIGSGIPLIPDFFDINERSIFTGTVNPEAMQTELLNYINKSRQDFGLSTVQTTPELNSIAQLHSEDMANNNFFGHINLNGEGPNDRRIKTGITTPVAENIAKDVSVKFAHMGLMRSASHRSNIYGKDWVSVGLGIAVKDGYVFVTEEFAGQQLTQADLAQKKIELFDAINKKRTDNNLSQISSNIQMDNATNFANSKMINENIDLDKFSNAILNEALGLYSLTGTVTAVGRSYNIWSELLSSIIDENNSAILDPGIKDMGIDIQLNKDGNIQVIIFLRK